MIPCFFVFENYSILFSDIHFLLMIVGALFGSFKADYTCKAYWPNVILSVGDVEGIRFQGTL
jgi:hypothetical protein